MGLPRFGRFYYELHGGIDAYFEKVLAEVLGSVQAEAAERGEDPYSSASFVAARAAQAHPHVTDVFASIIAQLAEKGVALEGDGLGWWRRGLYDKGRRLVATKAFRPEDANFQPACISCKYTSNLVIEQSNGENYIFKVIATSIFFNSGDSRFNEIITSWGCLWPAFAFRWRTKEEVAALDRLRHVDLRQPSSDSNHRVRDSAYFRAQEKHLLRQFRGMEIQVREGGVEQVRLWDRVALVRQLWGIPLPVSGDRDETYACIVACFCEVVFYNKVTLQSTVGRDCMYDVLGCYALGLNHSCMPNVHLRFADTSHAAENSLYNDTLVLYALKDIKVGEEVAMSYLGDTYGTLAMMQASLHLRHGFECRTCPRCQDFLHTPHVLDEECDLSIGSQERMMHQLWVCRKWCMMRFLRLALGKGMVGVGLAAWQSASPRRSPFLKPGFRRHKASYPLCVENCMM